MPIKVQGGKEYKLVAERLVAFHEDYDHCHICTDVKHIDGEAIVMKAYIKRTEDNQILATGHAMAHQNADNPIDKLLEKAETTAVGRALAFLDPALMGSEIASADELSAAFDRQGNQAANEYMDAVRAHWGSLVFIKDSLKCDQHSAALEAWRELGNDVMMVLWKAPSKGGVFTTEERRLLKEAASDEVRERNAV